MSDIALRCQSLTWQVKQKTILDQVSFAISRGETITIVGPNGAGKTSLLHCIAGLITDHQGHVYLANKTTNQLSRRAIAKQLAFVHQHHNSGFNLNCDEIIRMGLIPHKSWFSVDSENDQQQLQRALVKVGLHDKQHHPFDTLSGGEKQRLLIARALVQAPKILLMDEPTNHLDIYYQQQILALVNSLGLTVLMSLHDLNLASYYSDRILLLDKGQVIAFGSPRQVLQAPLLEHVFKVPCHISEQYDETKTSYPYVQFFAKPNTPVPPQSANTLMPNLTSDQHTKGLL